MELYSRDLQTIIDLFTRNMSSHKGSVLPFVSQEKKCLYLRKISKNVNKFFFPYCCMCIFIKFVLIPFVILHCCCCLLICYPFFILHCCCCLFNSFYTVQSRLRMTNSLRNFLWQFYLLSELLPEICWEEIIEEISFVFCFDVWPGARTLALHLIS